MLIAVVFGLIFTYLLSSYVVWMALVRYLDIPDEQLLKYFFLTLGTGPLLIALFLWAAYAFFPGRPDGFYLGWVLFLFAGLSLLSGRSGWQAGSRLCSVTRKNLTHFDWKSNLPAVFLTGATIIFLLVQIPCAVLTPVYGSDQSQYALVSSLGYERKTFDFYPLRDYEPETGYYDLSDHPPAYYMLKIWHYTLQGTAKFAGISKFIEPMSLFYLALIVGFALLPYGLLASGIGMALLVAVPGLRGSVEHHAIDAFRLVPFVLCLLWLKEALASPRPKMLTVAGFFTGLSMFPHSIGGLLSFPCFGSIYFVLSDRKLWQRVLDLALVGIVALLVGGWGYALNLMHSGSPVAAALPLLDQVKSIDYYTVRLFVMGIRDQGGMLWHGILKQFSNTAYFGLAAWFALMTPLLYFKRLKREPLILISLLASLGFLLLMTLASFFPQKRYIIFTMNPRYPLTVQPFLVMLAAIALATILAKAGKLVSSLLTGRFLTYRPLVGLVVIWGVVLFFSFQLLTVGKLITKPLRHGDASFYGNAIDWQSSHLGEHSYQFIERKIPKDKVILAQSDAMYAYNFRRYVIGDIYPKMLDFYNARSVPEAVQVLRNLKVDYLLMHTGWWPSVVSNTHMQDVISDPAITDIVFQGSTSFIFKLLPHSRPLHLISNEVPDLGRLKFRSKRVKTAVPYDSAKRQLKLAADTGAIAWEVEIPEGKRDPKIRYCLTGDIQGSGKLEVFLKWSSEESYDNWLWSSASAKPDKRSFHAQFVIPDGVNTVQILFAPELNTQPLVLENIKLTKVKVD